MINAIALLEWNIRGIRRGGVVSQNPCLSAVQKPAESSGKGRGWPAEGGGMGTASKYGAGAVAGSRGGPGKASADGKSQPGPPWDGLDCRFEIADCRLTNLQSKICNL